MKLEAEDDLFKVTVRWKEEKMEKPPVHTEPVEEADSLKSADLQPVDPQVSDLSLLTTGFGCTARQFAALWFAAFRFTSAGSGLIYLVGSEKNEMLEEQEEEKETDEP